MSADKDLVRQEYKKYKRKKPQPDFTAVIDFNNAEMFQCQVAKVQPRSRRLTLDPCKVGLIDVSNWEVFIIPSCPGFMFIKNPFLPGAQRYWAYKALTDYTRKPFPCNLDVHMELDEDKTIWEISKIKNPSNPYTFMEKLRWTHLGYHFDYNYVNYKEEKYYGFPEDLSKLMKYISLGLGFEDYSPETAIINYYPIGSSMGGHTDHYEEELNAPLISVSFGQPAVFLMGGKTKDIKPEAIWLRSGDIVIMAGESRTAYHAVPCIIQDESKEHLAKCLRFSHQDDLIHKDTSSEASDVKEPSAKLQNREDTTCLCGGLGERMFLQLKVVSSECCTEGNATQVVVPFSFMEKKAPLWLSVQEERRQRDQVRGPFVSPTLCPPHCWEA
eukprot:gene3371-3860_t